MFRNIILNVFLIFLYSTSIHAIEKRKLNDAEIEQKLNSLKWQNSENSKDHKIKIPGSKASIQIYEYEEYLLGQDIEQFHWWSYGKYNHDSVLEILTNDYMFIIDRPSNDGYIKIDDWSNVSPEELIQGIRDANKDKKDGLSYAKQVEWIYKPNLDKKNNMVNYSYKVVWSDNRINMESVNIILGRSGYIHQTFVFSDLSDTEAIAKYVKGAASDITFDSDYTYNNYKAGDKVAAVGISALVATTLGVKAIKAVGGGAAATGGFLLLLKKFWWIIMAPLVFIGKLFGGSEDKNQNNSSDRNLNDDSLRKSTKRKKNK